MGKVVSYYIRGFYDEETYSCVRDFEHSVLDEHLLNDVKEEHIDYLRNKNYVITNIEGKETLFFPKGTQFTKLTAGVLDLGDCWQRFALTENPEIKLLLNDSFVTMYELFGVEKPEKDYMDIDEDEEDYNYVFSEEGEKGWFY